MKNKIRIKKLENSFIRDKWGNLISCKWNSFIKNDILKLEKQYEKTNL